MVLGGVALLLLNGSMRLCDARAAQPKILLETNALTRDAKAISSFAPVVKKVTPSVVTVYSTKVVREELVNSPLFNDPFFRRFFGMDDDDNTPGHRPRQHQEQGLGSGVIISSNGYILSNNHVVENADEVKVSLRTARSISPKLWARIHRRIFPC